MSDPVKEVVIVGGGTAGWMAAAALSAFLPKDRTQITVIESEDIPTVGVGEATIPHIATFNKMIGVNEDDFVRECQATFKLGIEFANWGHVGERYFHPFGTYGFDLEGVEFHHFWAKLRSSGTPTELDEYSINAACAYAGKFIRPTPDYGPIIGGLGYAFHFDALLYAKYLRRLSEQRGVKRIEGMVTNVDLNAESGFISSVSLKNGEKHSGDLFIDCTGFRGLLINEALGVGYEDWRHWLPMDRAIAAPCAKMGDPAPYTRATAHAAGWQWRIPLQHRTGNGHVYSSAYMDDQQAEDILLANMDGPALAEPRRLRFTTGRRRAVWEKNCVALGLASGFLEPLESTSIHLIQFGIAQLIAMFPDASMNIIERDAYNSVLRDNVKHVRDFIILHYVATRRTDSDFWNYVRTMDIPDTLREKMVLLEERGRFVKRDSELFSLTSWLAVMAGQGFTPKHFNPVTDRWSDHNVTESLANMRKAVGKAAAALPTHQAFIDRFCRAEDVYI